MAEIMSIFSTKINLNYHSKDRQVIIFVYQTTKRKKIAKSYHQMNKCPLTSKLKMITAFINISTKF